MDGGPRSPRQTLYKRSSLRTRGSKIRITWRRQISIFTWTTGLMSNESDELRRLRAENARLITLIESHGIDWRRSPAPGSVSVHPPPEVPSLSAIEKVALFRRLFRGRTDVYPMRWESANTGKSGYAPACANEWHPGICEKPRIKCTSCDNRSLIPVSDAIIYSHLAGERTIGVYPLLPDDTCYFLAVDFD